MVPREIDDYDASETYYRLLPEGVFEDYDGETQNGRPNNFDLCAKVFEIVFLLSLLLLLALSNCCSCAACLDCTMMTVSKSSHLFF